MEVKIEPTWKAVLDQDFEKPYFVQLTDFVRAAYRNGTCYPPAGKIFAAFDRTPFDKVKVVILGQDPYHEPGQAQGLCFYVPPEIQAPPSLVNIAKELGHMPNLLSWTDQGVLLLNATLTVEAHKAGKSSPTPSSTPLPPNAKISSSSSGDPTRRKKARSSTKRAIVSSSRLIPRRSRPIAASSAPSPLPRPTPTCRSTDNSRLNGNQARIAIA